MKASKLSIYRSQRNTQRRLSWTSVSIFQRFLRHLLDDENLAEKGARITKALLEAQSPRLTDISEQMSGKSESRYKEIQRFSEEADLKQAVMRFYQEDAEFVIGDPTEMERYGPKNPLCGHIEDGKTAGYWLMVLSTAFRGRSLPCWFVVYSSRTIGEQSTSRNQEHYRCFEGVKGCSGIVRWCWIGSSAMKR